LLPLPRSNAAGRYRSGQDEVGCYHDQLDPEKKLSLHTEITELTVKETLVVYSLASPALPQFVTLDSVNKPFFDMAKLRKVTKVAIRNLDLVVDRTFYPVPEARHSNMLHCPLGLGVQGMADVFMMLRMPFRSPAARALNRAIFQSIYFAAVEASVDLAKDLGPYPSFKGSPASFGMLQFDLWVVKPAEMGYD
jgi:ribonucleoside-diphosphate reductase alpha chain